MNCSYFAVERRRTFKENKKIKQKQTKTDTKKNNQKKQQKKNNKEARKPKQNKTKIYKKRTKNTFHTLNGI